MLANSVCPNWRRWMAAGLIAGGICWASWTWRADSGLRAEVRQVPPPQHFQSGGARSELILVEIAATLKRIESQLDRLEQIAKRSAPAGAPVASGGGRPR